MNRCILDTDILSEVLKGKDPNVVRRATAYEAVFGRMTISAVTVMEVVRGLHKKQRVDALERFLFGLKASEVLAFDEACGEIAGHISGDCDRVGRPVGRADPMIAATALRHGLSLVTGNTDRYQQLQTMGFPLKLENWRYLE